MDWKAALYVGTTVVFLLIFAVIVFRTYSKRHKHDNEAAKYRMMDDD